MVTFYSGFCFIWLSVLASVVCSECRLPPLPCSGGPSPAPGDIDIDDDGGGVGDVNDGWLFVWQKTGMQMLILTSSSLTLISDGR